MVCVVVALAAFVAVRRPRWLLVRRTAKPSSLDALSRLDAPRAVRRGLGRWWLTALAFLLALLLWSSSYPGTLAVGTIISVTGVLLLGALWAYRFIRWLRAERYAGWARWAIAPVMVVVTLVLIITHVPLRVRFEESRSEFDRITRGLEPRGGFDAWEPLEVPDEIGTFQLVYGFQVGRNVIIYESHGWFDDDAGFAYLPDGIDPRLANGSFESPRFISLGGGWYAWRAGGDRGYDARRASYSATKARARCEMAFFSDSLICAKVRPSPSSGTNSAS